MKKFGLFLVGLASVVLPAGCAGSAPAFAEPSFTLSLGVPGPVYYDPCVYNRYSVNCAYPSLRYYNSYAYPDYYYWNYSDRHYRHWDYRPYHYDFGGHRHR